MPQSNLDNLKKELNAELSKDNSDIEVILSLAGEIAKFDEENIRFSIDAGVIDRLGRELVARQETAVSELVKNSYDADATLVKLTFSNSDKIGGSLEIDDDGEGMDKSDLVNGFMRISSTSKIHHPISKKYQRRRAGQKGIGRFSVQRLGYGLEIITQKKESATAIKLTIDWSKYQNDTDLLSISNNVRQVPKTKEHGTTIIITNLRDRWSQTSIKRIFRYVSDVIQPFILSKAVHENNTHRISETADPGFRTEFNKVDNGVTKSIEDDTKIIYDYALAVIEGYIDPASQGIYTITSSRLPIDDIGNIGNDPDNNSAPFKYLQNVHFRAYYFVWDSDLVPKAQLTKLKRLASSYGGIRLYRNGFRVLPYAEPGDDWLKLDRSLRTRSLLPSHGNNNFFGFVEIQDSGNLFTETSSREGLMENEAFVELQNFIYRTIITGVIRVSEIRNVKLIPSQNKDGELWEKIELRIKNIAHTLEDLDKSLDEDESNVEAKKARKNKITQLKKDLKNVSELQKKEQAAFLKEKSMLRVLSSVGLTIGQFIHEIKYYLENIQSDVAFLLKQLENDLQSLERVQILAANFSSFHTYTSYFDTVISQNIIRDLRPLEIRNVVKPFLASLKEDAKKADIHFAEAIYNGYRLYTKPMHPSEWSSILFNFYTNSRKAIKRANISGKILIECGESNGNVYLEFSDNGDGISKENEERIFDEFFTTTSPLDFSNLETKTEILGTGLGLKIVKDIVTSYKGNVMVVSPKGDFSTCLRVEIPKSTEKELLQYGL